MAKVEELTLTQALSLDLSVGRFSATHLTRQSHRVVTDQVRW